MISAVVCIIQQHRLNVSRSVRHSMGHDELTGLYNLEHMAEKIKELRNDKAERYLIYTDIPDLGLINEMFGREKGNLILKEIADIIRASVYKGSFYCRTNGVHFVILTEKSAFREEMLESIRESAEHIMDGTNYKLRVHFGIYETTGLSDSLEAMCGRAAIAVNSIKNSTQEYIAFYDRSMMQEAIRNKRTIDEFEAAMKNGEFHMFLQPQFSADTGRLTGAEALVRRIKSDGSVVPPNDFIPIYERAGIICRLDKYIWEKAAAKLSEWKGKNIDGHISVNISPRDFYYINVYDGFTELISRYDIPADRLNIEITETALMTDVPDLEKELEMLRDAGFTVEIDDFGSGYSSLNALKDIKVDVLKIDMGFLSKSSNAERGRIILDCVIQMAKKLNMHVITEGVEKIEQVKFLTDMGCDCFQGYYFSKPISIDEYEKKYLDGNIRKQKEDFCA